jgi:hypothetical protein
MSENRKPYRASALAAVLIFFAAPSRADCPTEPVTNLLKSAWTVALVHVVQSTFPGPLPLPPVRTADEERKIMSATAKVLVLKSWRGHFPLGTYVDISNFGMCFGSGCDFSSLPVGDDFVVFSTQDVGPIIGMTSYFIEKYDARCVIEVLDKLAAKSDLPEKPGF